MPVKYIADKDLSFEIVRPVAIEGVNAVMKKINARLDNGPWWYGDTWSVIDGYLYWVWSRITGVGYDGSAYPNILRHHELCNERPAVQRAMAREAVNIETLKAEGLFIPPR